MVGDTLPPPTCHAAIDDASPHMRYKATATSIEARKNISKRHENEKDIRHRSVVPIWLQTTAVFILLDPSRGCLHQWIRRLSDHSSSKRNIVFALLPTSCSHPLSSIKSAGQMTALHLMIRRLLDHYSNTRNIDFAILQPSCSHPLSSIQSAGQTTALNPMIRRPFDHYSCTRNIDFAILQPSCSHPLSSIKSAGQMTALHRMLQLHLDHHSSMRCSHPLTVLAVFGHTTASLPKAFRRAAEEYFHRLLRAVNDRSTTTHST